MKIYSPIQSISDYPPINSLNKASYAYFNRKKNIL